MVKLKQTRLKQMLSASMVGAIALIASVSSVQAVLLPPPPPNTAATPLATTTEIAGTVVGDITVPFGIGTNPNNSAYGGTIQSVVVRRTGTAPLLNVGGLDFYYQIKLTGVNPPSADIRAFTLTNFDPFVVDAYVDIGSGVVIGVGGRTQGTQAPYNVGRAPTVVGFSFTDNPQPDASLVPATPNSVWVVLRTNATLFGNGNAGLLDGFADNARILAPIPEPTTLLFGLGLVATAGFSRMRKSRSGEGFAPLA
jgi:hypothetical protein